MILYDFQGQEVKGTAPSTWLCRNANCMRKQPPCHEDIHATLWRHQPGGELRPRANSRNPHASHMSGPHRNGSSSPALSSENCSAMTEPKPELPS